MSQSFSILISFVIFYVDIVISFIISVCLVILLCGFLDKMVNHLLAKKNVC